jgi:tetratricopeptide (TPR) repeat protein
MIRRQASRAPWRVATLVLGATLVYACAGTSGKDSGTKLRMAPTLGDLTVTPGMTDPQTAMDDVNVEQAIAAYRAYLVRYPNTPEYRAITRRLADLMVEQAANMQAVAPATGQEVTRGASKAMRYYDDAIEIYENLLQEAPEGQARAELLYQLARTLEARGEPRRSMVYLDQLITRYPGIDTRIYADALFRRGELLFGERDWPAAGQDYRAVVALGESTTVYEASLYKLGWCLLRQERHPDALAVFFTLLDRKLPPGADPDTRLATLTPSEREQVADVFRAISLSFSSMAGVDSVTDYFKRHGSRAYETRIYRNLAEFYSARDLYTEAARTWLAMAQNDPDSPLAPRLYLKAMRAYGHAGLEQPLRETRVAFLGYYGPDSGFWSRNPPAGFPDVWQSLQSSLIQLARQDHARARDTNNASDFRQAERWYRIWLGSFGDDSNAAEMHYELAKLLYETGRYREAAEEYERSASAWGDNPQAADAGYGAVLARLQQNKHIDAESGDPAAQELTATAIRFVETYPGHTAAAAVLARIGADMLERDEFTETIHVSTNILQNPAAGSALRQTAWTLQAQAHDKLGNYHEAEHAYRQALELAGGNADKCSAITQALAAMYYRQAEQYNAQGDARTAADLFRQAGRTAPASPIRPKAEYDEAAALLSAGEWDTAARILEQLRMDYPQFPHQEELAQKLAYAYDRSERYTEAAAEYLRLGSGTGNESLRREALLRAAELYRSRGELDAAVKALETYYNQFSRPVDEVIGVEQQLADLEQRRGRPERRRYWLQKIIATDRGAGAARSLLTRQLAAGAALELAEFQRADFQRMRLVEPLQNSLARKLKTMKQALALFQAAIDYGIAPVTTAATHRIASMYDELSQDLLDSERPGSLDGEQLAKYERLLEQQASVFENKAIAIYTANSERIKAGQGDAWTMKSSKRLNELTSQRLKDMQQLPVSR